jgi:hypothetical protein
MSEDLIDDCFIEDSDDLILHPPQQEVKSKIDLTIALKNDMTDLSDSELDLQLEALTQEKKDRESAKKCAEMMKGEVLELLYWEAPTYEILAELHRMHKLQGFDFSALLHKAIENKDLIFATKLILSGLIPNICYSSCGCRKVLQECHHSLHEYFNKVIILCMSKNDLARLKLLIYYDITYAAAVHGVPSPERIDDIPFADISNFEKQRILKLHEEKKAKSADASCGWESYRKNYLVQYIFRSAYFMNSDDNMVKYVLSNYNQHGDATLDSAAMAGHACRWLNENNREMISFMRAKMGDNLSKQILLSAVCGNNSAVFLYDIDKLNWIYSLVGSKFLNLTNGINENTIKTIPLHIVSRMLENELTYNTDAQRTEHIKRLIREKLYLASQYDRKDIMVYFMQNRLK